MCAAEDAPNVAGKSFGPVAGSTAKPAVAGPGAGSAATAKLPTLLSRKTFSQAKDESWFVKHIEAGPMGKTRIALGEQLRPWRFFSGCTGKFSESESSEDTA